MHTEKKDNETKEVAAKEYTTYESVLNQLNM